MSAALAVNVVVVDKQQNPVVLTAGEEVPGEYADQVGPHCFVDTEDETPARKTRARTTDTE